MLALMACLGIDAKDQKIAIKSAVANSAQSGNEASKAIDGSTSTIWHSTWSTATQFPVTFTITLKEAAHVDYVRYIPRQDGNSNGNWHDVYVAYCPTTTGTNFVSIGKYSLQGTSAQSDIWLTEKGTTCGQIRFTIESGSSNFASAAEIEAYAVDNSYTEQFAQYFTDAIFSELKPEVTSSEGIEDATLKALVDNLLNDANAYKKFRVGEYEPYMTLGTLQKRLGTKNQYNRYENPTGIYLKAGESCVVAVSGINSQYPVGLIIKNWVTNEGSSSYSLRNGLNTITAKTEGNVFVNYFTDDFETAPNVQIHFINAPVQGYWDQETMTNEDWVELLKGRSKEDNTILITRSEHAQLAYPVSAWLQHCPTNVDSTMTLYQQVQWAERDILGLEKYGLQTKNRQLFYATNYGFMAAGGEGSYCNVSSLGAIMTPNAASFDFWGVGHEWGHNNQIDAGFHWSGCGETTNNIYASWAQLHFTGARNSATGKPTYLRLEDENSGINEYSGTRGGRMQTYFEEAIRKGVAWQLQDGPDYHGATPDTKTVNGYDADGKNIGMVTTTSRNYDHFVKLVPFWQLNLWGTLSGKCPDIIPMIIQSIRTTDNYASIYNTNGKKQVNWMKLACDSAKIDLLPFFEKAGMLRPINAYIEDYGAGWNIINEKMINELKDYVKEQGYPAFTEEINYINGHNYHIYRDCLKLEVPEKMGEGCSLSGNKLKVQHDIVKNAVAFETYNLTGELIRITMYGLGSNDEHSYTQVLYPKGSTPKEKSGYVMAVGYDGTRVKIFEERNMEEAQLDMLRDILKKAKSYLTFVDETNTKAGYFVSGALTGLSELITKVDAVVLNKDTEEYSYTEWYTQLDTTMVSLLQNEQARVPLYANCYYSIFAKENPLYSICYASAGLKATTAGMAEYENQWLMEPASEEGTYYLKNRASGYYISAANDGSRAKAAAKATDNALTFRLVMGEPGEFKLQRVDNETLYLYFDSSNRYIKGIKGTANATLWNLTLADDMLSLPEEGTDGKVIIYHIQCVDNGSYLYKSSNKRTEGRVSTGQYTSEEDTDYWFYFTKGGIHGDKYRIYNYATGKSVTLENGNYYANKDIDVFNEYTFTAAADRSGLTVSSADGNWYVVGSNLTANTTEQSHFRLIKIGEKETPTSIETAVIETEAVYYDLTGRIVTMPVKGIYIHNGKKIILK